MTSQSSSRHAPASIDVAIAVSRTKATTRCSRPRLGISSDCPRELETARDREIDLFRKLSDLKDDFRVGVRAVHDVLAERKRQIQVEGFTPVHDDEYQPGTMADAAMAYLVSAQGRKDIALDYWPWRDGFKPKNRRHDLVRAAALLIAEIERMDRAAAQTEA